MCGRGYVWSGICLVGDMSGRGCVWERELLYVKCLCVLSRYFSLEVEILMFCPRDKTVYKRIGTLANTSTTFQS